MNHKALPILSMAVSLVALVIAIAGFSRSEAKPVDTEAIAHAVYQDLVQELWQDFKPIYKDFDWEIPENVTTVREVLKPLMTLDDLSPDSEADVDGASVTPGD